MRFVKLSVLAVLCLSLFGCGPMYQVSHSYKNPTTWRGKQCMNRCIANRSRCENQCRTINQRCRNNAIDAAKPKYRAYVRQQHRQNKKVKRSLESFANLSRCRSGCSCTPNYNQCFTNCGGEIITHRKCVAFCPKPGGAQ